MRNGGDDDDDVSFNDPESPSPPAPPPLRRSPRVAARARRGNQGQPIGQIETGQSSSNPFGTATPSGNKRGRGPSPSPSPPPSKKPKSGGPGGSVPGGPGGPGGPGPAGSGPGGPGGSGGSGPGGPGGPGQNVNTDALRWARHVLQRPLPVSRPQAYPAQPVVSNPPTNLMRRTHRIQALRNQIRFPHGQNEETLTQLLTWANWDVNRAATLFWESEILERAHRPTGRLMPSWNRRAVNVEQTRLNLLHDIQDGIRNRQVQVPEYLTTNAIMAMVLQRNNWDLHDASTNIAARRGRAQASGVGVFDDIVDGLTSMRTPPEGVPAQDRRLAEFVTLTSTNSVDAARRVLVRHDWDLALAIDEWVLRGGIPVQNSDGQRREWNPNRPRTVINAHFEYHEDEAPLPRHPNPSVEGGQSEGLTMEQPRRRNDIEAIHPRDYDAQESGGGRRGYVIDEDRQPANRGVPDESRLRIEYIRNGGYHIELFGRRDDGRSTRYYNFTEVADPQRREFDWDDRDHISDLNKWRAERFRTIAGENVRDETIPFNKYELAWLVEQEAMRVEEKFFEAAEQNRFDTHHTSPAAWDAAMRKFGDGDTYPLPMSQAEKEDLADRFNETFAGRTLYTKWRTVRKHLDDSAVWERVYKDMATVGVVPRPERSVGMLDQRRRRIRAHCKHFGLQFEKGDPGQSESDSDF
ncbi:hypothetical protein PV08_03483 [Exophiala spinifera]|uniref:Uncharacterized protein n=1 Tax=Exophiala spinifera TaxID=91928 RepID=A0A0D2C6I6_9EURO|nr:uncharacterized protein PV08_03483 [Exophiala spinifera]KIW19189.1 hypothetical protein PV08_03483 [Exophiala spinifera]